MISSIISLLITINHKYLIALNMVNGVPLNGYTTDISMDIQSSPTPVSNNSNLIHLGISIQ